MGKKDSGGNSISSLKRVDNAGIKAAWDTFAQCDKRFAQISDDIYHLDNRMGDNWEGEAYDEYKERFRIIFRQVREIGDSLKEFADGLKEAYSSFYEGDDGLAQQLLEASYNSSKESGGNEDAGDTKKDYKELHKVPELYSTIMAAYVPNLSYPAMNAKPVLVSTIGAAYQPDLSYATMHPKPVLQSCLPSATMLNLTYRNLEQKEKLKSVIGDAIQISVDWLEMARKEVLQSTIGAPYEPDLSYVPMEARALDIATLNESLRFLLDYTAAGGSLKDIKNGLMAGQINQIVIESMAMGRSGEETARLLGEAVVGKIYGQEMSPAGREQLVSIVGNAVYGQMYGHEPGAKVAADARPVIDWIDSPQERETLGMLSDLVGEVKSSGVLAGDRPVNGAAVLTASTAAAFVPQYNSTATSSVADLIGTRAPLGTVDSSLVSLTAARIAKDGNMTSFERIVGQICTSKSGGSSVLPVTPTVQSTVGNIITIGAGVSPVGGSGFDIGSLVSGAGTPETGAAVGQIVNSFSPNLVSYDFSSMRMPPPGLVSNGYPVM